MSYILQKLDINAFSQSNFNIIILLLCFKTFSFNGNPKVLNRCVFFTGEIIHLNNLLFCSNNFKQN